MFYFKLIISPIILLVLCENCRSSRADSQKPGWVRVNKCCEPNEILLDLRCVSTNETKGSIQMQHLLEKKRNKLKPIKWRIACFYSKSKFKPNFCV